ncbi:hypothetical protein [Ferrimicrobium acidiphilum]|uniref:hypothetical protein n=1 Tax=Ferrimicrobium acidiphilum TaxID=121039 RepID=UPI00126A6E3B|nr:hypothetical protein [Ferrimicrobium acidiphilum]MCL5052930.1 hypothetical protein [Gammaproteobacteria bacterium]
MTPSHARPDLGGQSYSVGRRNTSPAFLMGLSLIWILAAAVCGLYLHTSWRLIPIVVAFGIGALYLRSATGAYLRRTR